jgi:hypothetical protein
MIQHHQSRRAASRCDRHEKHSCVRRANEDDIHSEDLVGH